MDYEKRLFYFSRHSFIFKPYSLCSDTDQSLQTSGVALINVNLIGTDYASIDYRRYISISISQSK
ncbi:hypothetical protein [Elizabethkingia anophelis]|uniref:hypothetical protein n=1 Tax=Elizabethkingia anophelis TaxID=1117645 RepID=UPI003209FB0F